MYKKKLKMHRLKDKSVLMIFAREPEHGKVKTRLLKGLPIKVVTRLYKAFVSDILHLASQIQCDKKVVCFTSFDSAIEFLCRFKDRFQLTKQRGNDLGERMYNALKDYWHRGYKRLVIIGTDCLTLRKRDLDLAFQKLSRYDVVLGPSRDGGYYLIGLTKPIRSIFSNMHWGSDKVFKITLQRLRKSGRKVFFLHKRADIDTIEELRNFKDSYQKYCWGVQSMAVIKGLSVLK